MQPAPVAWHGGILPTGCWGAAVCLRPRSDGAALRQGRQLTPGTWPSARCHNWYEYIGRATAMAGTALRYVHVLVMIPEVSIPEYALLNPVVSSSTASWRNARLRRGDNARNLGLETTSCLTTCVDRHKLNEILRLIGIDSLHDISFKNYDVDSEPATPWAKTPGCSLHLAATLRCCFNTFKTLKPLLFTILSHNLAQLTPLSILPTDRNLST